MSSEETNTSATSSARPSNGGQSGQSQSTGTTQTPVVDMPSFDGDLAAMNAHVSFLDSMIAPHFEGLINGASQQGMGQNLLAELGQSQESVSSARAAMGTAIAALTQANAAVAQAYADAREAATNKAYYQSE